MKQAVLLLAILLIAVPVAAASRPSAEQQAIDWLLSEVQHTDAVFIRNGKEYDGEKAASHLKTKLWFAGNRVQTARDFIVGVATHSEETGKPYEIRLKDGTQGPLGRWLLDRLDVYQKGKANAK